MIAQSVHEWQGPGGSFVGHLAVPSGSGSRSAVLLAPTVFGPSDFERSVAARLAERGHIVLVVDMYGDGRSFTEIDAARPMMDALDADRPLLAARIVAALDSLRALADVDPARIAAFGYCFGGKCVLDLARAGAAVTGVVSFHGLLDAPPDTSSSISARVLALHGWDDDLVPPDQVVAFAAEMTALKADWQLHAYGHTGHAFTNPARQAMYRPDADRRSWASAMDFLDELFV